MSARLALLGFLAFASVGAAHDGPHCYTCMIPDVPEIPPVPGAPNAAGAIRGIGAATGDFVQAEESAAWRFVLHGGASPTHDAREFVGASALAADAYANAVLASAALLVP